MDKNNYRLWWRCLQLSNRNRWTGDVEDAFGDGQGLPFDEWWSVCEELFSKPDKLLLHEIESAKELERWYVGDGSDVVILVNLLSPKTELLAAFEKLLHQLHQGVRGRPVLDDWAEWKLCGTPNVRAITRALDVWEFAEQHRDMTNWRIAQVFKINPVRSGDKPDSDDRKVLNAQVSRYKAHAERLIRGVERGVFPAK